ncbi:MAG: hypothetical protein GY750_07165 [Lentisphaerae bacterium]|nr:hypothetical protein [Lentisphaerota bacterium]MCP4101189.1 hypothetical protein [Lentisphaerota bacterium]
MKMFPKLAETTVEVVCDENTSYEVEKLSILEFSQIDELIGQVNRSLDDSACDEDKCIECIDDARQKIIEIIAPHFPEKPAVQLWRLDYRQICDLALHMAFGSSRKELIENEAVKKKAVPQSSERPTMSS